MVSLLIQLNKPVFIPNGFVQFRVFALDSKTRPYQIKKASKVWILDPFNNQVKVWKNPAFERGLLEKFLKLNDAEPGIWKILVEADGEVRIKNDFRFKVELFN